MSKTKKSPVKSIQELRYKLTELYAALENDEIDHAKAKHLNNTAANIIKTVHVDLIKSQTVGSVSDIDFILTTKEIEEKNQKNIGIKRQLIGKEHVVEKQQYANG